jgi:uncharacterized protein
MILPFLFIAPTSLMGRGVFTSEDIEADTIVEIAPVIVMTKATVSMRWTLKLN